MPVFISFFVTTIYQYPPYFFCLAVCLFVCMSFCHCFESLYFPYCSYPLPHNNTLHSFLPVCLSVSICLCIYLYIYPSICLYLPIYLHTYLNIYLSIYVCLSLSISCLPLVTEYVMKQDFFPGCYSVSRYFPRSCSPFISVS